MRYQINSQEFSKFLGYLLEQKIVDQVLSGIENRKHYAIKPEFVEDPKALENFPLSQLMVYGYARSDSAANEILHSHRSLEKKVAVIGHACDFRAIAELNKKLQAKWENIFKIGFVDYGFIENKSIMKILKDNSIEDADIVYERLTQSHLILTLKDGSIKKFSLNDKFNVAANCQRCNLKSHELVDIEISTYGLPEDSQDFIITPKSKQGITLVNSMKWKEISGVVEEKYQQEASAIIESCTIKRQEELEKWQNTPDKFDVYAKCTGCGMCVTSCPVCFCTTCNLIDQVKTKNLDKLSFVLTRFSHVGDTCVECGRCESNCPAGIPIALVFQSLRTSLEKKYKYKAGQNPKGKPLHLDV